MSDRIPFHIQEEIMERLPVKSLVQFRSVSKAWKSLIDSSEFIAAHSLHLHIRPHHLLVSYGYPVSEENDVFFTRCYIDDDDTFLHQSSVPTLPPSVTELLCPTVVGSSQGLLCLYGFHPNTSSQRVYLWNPSIRKSVVVVVPGKHLRVLFNDHPVEPYIGFGVCPVTKDPKIVAISRTSELMIYSLSSGKWRSLSIDLLTDQIQGLFISVVTERFIYWDVKLPFEKMIMSFDLTSESFDMIHLPYCLSMHDYWCVRISKLRDSLALLYNSEDYTFSSVWVMEHGAQKSFTKLFSITTPHVSIVGFRGNGMPIMSVWDDDGYDDDRYDFGDDDGQNKLVVYEPNLEDDNVLEMRNADDRFYLHSYKETLLLHGRSDCSSY